MLWWNDNELALNIATGIGPVLQVGQEQYILIYNDSSINTIPNGVILRPKAATIVDGEIIPTVEYAKADNWETVEGTLMASTMDILPLSIGLATKFGRVRGANTSGLQPGATAYISDTSPGYVTNERPRFPSYAIPVGAALSEGATAEAIFGPPGALVGASVAGGAQIVGSTIREVGGLATDSSDSARQRERVARMQKSARATNVTDETENKVIERVGPRQELENFTPTERGWIVRRAKLKQELEMAQSKQPPDRNRVDSLLDQIQRHNPESYDTR